MAYRNTAARALDLDRLDLIINQAEDVGNERGKDGLQLLAMSVEDVFVSKCSEL